LSEPLHVALHVPDRARLDRLVAGDTQLAGLPGADRVDRLHFGVEFCEHLLPSADDVGAAADVAAARGWGFTLLTPYGTDRMVDAVADLVEAAPRPREVVVNDWGVLHRLRGADVALTVGRGLNRMIRDPRVPDVGPEHLGGDAPPDSWRRSSADSATFRALLASLGVVRVETDVPLQGPPPPPPADALRTTLHLPWGMVASGRICLVNALGKPPSVRLTAPVACNAPCRRYTIELRAPWSRRQEGAAVPAVGAGELLPLSRLLKRRRTPFPAAADDPAPRFFQKGNTHFYRLGAEAALEAWAWAEGAPGVDRVVLEPDLPM